MESTGTWSCLPFDELSGADVYDLLQLRAAVFVVEQECAYLDPDGDDREAWHWLYRDNERLLATQRCMPPGLSYPEYSSIGRIVVDPAGRGLGLSRELVRRGIAFNFSQWPAQAIKIGAQAHLQALYESLGFVVVSDTYLEDGIPHLAMRLNPSEAA